MKHLVLILLFTLTACNVASISAEQPRTAEQWFEKQAHPKHIASASNRWWKQFKDPILEALVDDALRSNPDVKHAAAKILEVRGQEKTAMGDLFPNISAGFSADRQRTSFVKPATGNDINGSFDASYEVDLFGKNRKAYEAADWAIKASEEDYEWAKISIIAEVARVYTLMRAQDKHVLIAQKNMDTQKKILELVTRRHAEGVDSKFDIERAARQIKQTESEIEEFKRQRGVHLHSLAMLSGISAHELHKWLKPDDSIPGLNLTAFADSPAAVLAKRPDIAAASFRLSQATSLKESQAAAIFPTISLSGLFGFSKTILVNTINVWQVMADASMPVLDFGRIQGKIDAASAREMQAYEAWRKTVLQGVQDVETALNNIARIHNSRVALREAKKSAESALELARVRYKEGDISFLDVLDAEYQVHNTDNSLIDAEGNYVVAVIALYKAIGQY